MRNFICRCLSLPLILGLGLSLGACAKVPGTGRSQLSLVNDKALTTMAAQQYSQLMKQQPLSSDAKAAAQVKRVGAKLARAAETLLKEEGRAAETADYKWEFNLIESKEANAFCMPGGKVGIYSGLLPYTKDEAGLAVVMGHEIAHAIAHHSRERASQELLANLGGNILDIGLRARGESALTYQMAMSAYGLGGQVGVILPFSRIHESEADRIGLTLMAMAGYDPEQAAPFWRRFSESSKNKGGPAFLSTHPTNRARLEGIEKYLPEAKARYQTAKRKKS